jgi:predicted ATP-grasp superfamily ATP-dependent carboligase
MEATSLLTALDALSRSHQPVGVVCGTGFEDRPQLLARIAERWRLLGNDPHVVARVKDPVGFATLCRDRDIAHPDTIAMPPRDATGWLAKRKGGAGGGHIVGADTHTHLNGEYYFQRRIHGVPASALFLADGRRAVMLGFSTQWASPTGRRPYRYGGAVRPAAIAPATAAALASATQRLMQAIPLVGLNSADFLVDGNEFRLLEVNPRPGATLDMFEPAEGSLFALHVAACEGRLSDAPPRLDGACAAAIVYAECDIATAPAMQWPDWTADRPPPGTAIKAGEPLCTVKAAAATADAAKARVDERLAMVLAMVHDRTHARMS